MGVAIKSEFKVYITANCGIEASAIKRHIQSRLTGLLASLCGVELINIEVKKEV